MRIGEYATVLLLFLQLCGVCGIGYFKEPPLEYIPYLVSLIAVWGAFGFLMGSEPK